MFDQAAFIIGGTPRGTGNAGVLQAASLVWGRVAEISDALVKAPEIRKISLIGAPRVGRLVATTAGAELKRTTMELGGHAPVIVAADADFDTLVPMAVTWKSATQVRSASRPSAFRSTIPCTTPSSAALPPRRPGWWLAMV